MRLYNMPSCNSHQRRLSCLLLGPALFITVGASATLRAQEFDLASTSYSSSLSATPDPGTAPATLPSTAPAALPDAPGAILYPGDPQSSSSQDTKQNSQDHTPKETTNPDDISSNGTHQTKRILGIMPNFRSVSADVKLPPMSPKEKFIIAGKDTFDYSSFFIAGVQTTFSKSGNSYPEFGTGVVGFGRYYWHTLADTIDENFFVGGLGPIVFHPDNRFYTLGHGGFVKRTSYAWTRVLISRKDDGSKTFNFAEVIGSGASSGISTLYYPSRYTTWTKVGQKWLTSDLLDGANFMLKEFWPDINKFITHRHSDQQ
jgi:hypothetical protein